MLVDWTARTQNRLPLVPVPQVNRRAAVRLMFETASSGVLTDGTPIYGEGRLDQSALAAAETVYSSLLNETKVERPP